MTFWMYLNFEYVGLLEGNVLIICDEAKCKHIVTTLEPVGFESPTQNLWKGCKFHVTELFFCRPIFSWQMQYF